MQTPLNSNSWKSVNISDIFKSFQVDTYNNINKNYPSTNVKGIMNKMGRSFEALPLHSPSPSLIYVTYNSYIYTKEEYPVFTGTTATILAEKAVDVNASFPLFLPDVDTIFVPKKIQRNLERYTPKKYLDAIDLDRAVAVEKCLLVISNLSSTFYNDSRWIKLSSLILHQQTRQGEDNTYVYKSVLEALKFGTKKSGPMIEVLKNKEGKECYIQGVESKSYKVPDTYFKAGLTAYKLKDKRIVEKRNEFFKSQIIKATENPIASNLMNVYPRIKLPKHSEILDEGKRLVGINYTTKKGKRLTLLNNHSKDYFKNYENRSFVEDNINLYEYLTARGYRVPVVGDVNSGGRVVDSFVLIPSWIRNLIKIDGEPIVEVDFRALHPNIAMNLYQGSKKYITHQMVAKESTIALKDVKKEHLSFFNKKVVEMKKSKLYTYYNESEPEMLEAIVQEKWNSTSKYKITAHKMFAKEVEIMTECVKRLNLKGIYVGYVYDALFCKERDALTVEKIMNEVVLEFGVYTTAKVSW